MFQRKKMNRKVAGFTLLEVMTVLAILAILLAAGIPQIMNMANANKLTGATQSIAWAIQSTRYQAIMKGYYYQLTINPTNLTTQVYSKIPPATSFSTLGNSVPISSASVTLSPSTSTTYQFSPSGAITVIAGNSNPNTITVTYQSQTHTITVANYGSVTVQ
jgi:prepilin-type N-terminal cleavage/methylation domain-containing protein